MVGALLRPRCAELVAFSKLQVRKKKARAHALIVLRPQICLLRSDSFDCPIPNVVEACKPHELRRNCNNTNAERLARLAAAVVTHATPQPTPLNANLAAARAGFDYQLVDRNAPPGEQVKRHKAKARPQRRAPAC